MSRDPCLEKLSNSSSILNDKIVKAVLVLLAKCCQPVLSAHQVCIIPHYTWHQEKACDTNACKSAPDSSMVLQQKLSFHLVQPKCVGLTLQGGSYV